MYTTPTASREKALQAVAAAGRAMKRHVCCKSQFKFKCFSCGEMINRGDKITKCTTAGNDGMDLRFRGADSRNGITFEETAFYMGESGTRSWVHIGCNPCFWESLPEDSNEYSPPALRGVWTDWGAKMSHEFDEWRQRTNHYNMEEFLEKHGYPQEKFMKDRVIAGVTKFQSLWRGHRIYKISYIQALRAARGIEAINLNARDTLSTQTKPWEKYSIGDYYEGVFNRHSPTEAIYSGVIHDIYVPMDKNPCAIIYVKFHDDNEIRGYYWNRFEGLKKECQEFKFILGLENYTIRGMLATKKRYTQNSASL